MRMLDNIVWSLATVTDDEPIPSVTLHDNYASAQAWLRSGWDVDGRFNDLDNDDLIDALCAAEQARASIDPHDRVITRP